VKRIYRLRRGRDFRRLRHTGRVYVHPLLVLRVAANDLPLVRMGVTAGRKVGTAVVRNKVKRRLREILRARLPHLPPGYDLWWIARPRAARASFAALQDAVDALLQQAGLTASPASPNPGREEGSP